MLNVLRIFFGLQHIQNALFVMERNNTTDMNNNNDNRVTRVVIVGGGFGGLEVAKTLAGKEVDVLMLDKNNYHTFQPLLYQVATGSLQAESIAFSLRKNFDSQKNLRFRIGELLKVIPEKNTIETTIGNFEYDYLVIATGSTTNFFGNKDVEKFSMPMKSIPEALNLRYSILQNIEEALLAGLYYGVDWLSITLQRRQHRWRGEISVPYVMLYRLEVPDSLPGFSVQRQQTISKEVVADPIATVKVKSSRPGWNKNNSTFAVERHPRPIIGGATLLPRVLGPGFVTELAGMRDGVK